MPSPFRRSRPARPSSAQGIPGILVSGVRAALSAPRAWAPTRRAACPGDACRLHERAQQKRLRWDLIFPDCVRSDMQSARECGPVNLIRPVACNCSMMPPCLNTASEVNGASIPHYLPTLRTRCGRDDADRRLPVLLRVHGMRRAAQAKTGRLLRVLFLWLGSLPAHSGSRGRRIRQRGLLCLSCRERNLS